MINRSVRIQSQPARHPSFVRFSLNGTATQSHSAQFADLSSSGMQLISRRPTSVSEKDVIHLSFTLPGNKEELEVKAQVVRSMNEFVFSVKFIEVTPEKSRLIKSAISKYLSSIEENWLRDFSAQAKKWAQAHRTGLIASACGVMGAIIISGFIYVKFEAEKARGPQPWGHYKKEWFNQYYK